MSQPLCPACKRKRHVVTKIEKQKGKKYWVSRCTVCLTPIKMDDYEDNRKKS